MLQVLLLLYVSSLLGLNLPSLLFLELFHDWIGLFGAEALDIFFKEIFRLLFSRALIHDPILNLVEFSLSHFFLLIKA